MLRANPTRLSSQNGKEKDVSKKISIYIAPLRPKTQRRLKDRELNQARSKPDTVNRPVGTARIFVHHYTLCYNPLKHSVLVRSTVTQRQFLFIFPFLQTNITSQYALLVAMTTQACLLSSIVAPDSPTAVRDEAAIIVIRLTLALQVLYREIGWILRKIIIFMSMLRRNMGMF